MIDDFRGTSEIRLQPLNDALPYSFEVTVCSAVDGNDGAIPYGQDVASVSVSATNMSTGATATSDLISDTPSVTDNVITAKLKWPGAAGWYKLTFACTLSGNSVIELDFKRIEAVDL